MQDIVFPEKNEQAFITRAKTLGIKELVFVYSNPDLFYKPASTVKITNALIATPSTMEKAKRQAKFVIIGSSDQDLHVIEHRAPTILFDLEQSPKHDALHQRASGLNHIMAKACAKNGVAVGFSLNSILSAGPQKRAVLLGRIMQNIKLCRKFKVKMKIASFAKSPGGMRNPADIKSLAVVLGFDSLEAQKALEL